ncbi:16426_t:CDS:2 [Rhizophagus irregularis]|nr:16426_t:CDS:2 [Rhizophagus irregularis]
MCDPVVPQLPQEVKKVSYDTINIKLKSVSDQVSLQDSVQAGTIEEEPQMSSNFNDTSTVVDLMNFDDDWLISNDDNFDSDPIRKAVQDVNVSMIDQLLCDLNFGRDYKNETKNSNVNNVQEKVPPVSSPANSMKETPLSYPSYAEPTNGTRPPHTNFMNAKQTADPSHVKAVNGKYPTVMLCTHNMKETREEIISSAMQMKRQSLVGKPRNKRIYSFFELMIYQFSPITKELHANVNKRFSSYAYDYDLLKDNPQANGQPRRPGVLRGTTYTAYQQRNGRNQTSTSPTRKHFESPLELSFLKECVIAQNRWTALLKERELRTSCIKEFKDCKSMKWINAHMNFTDKHSESCLVHHVKNEARYYGKNIRSEEKDTY